MFKSTNEKTKINVPVLYKKSIIKNQNSEKVALTYIQFKYEQFTVNKNKSRNCAAVYQEGCML